MFGLVRTMLHSLEKKREGGSGGEQRERDACGLHGFTWSGE